MSKKIILFADGTGNAFSKQESNIWRLFDALDTSQNDQFAYYIEGVGTSSFRPWAIFDGATGVGAPANIRKLYRFLCWNWEKDDEIYMFGFSRGAFTIRALIELIKSEGLLPNEFGGKTISHEEMERNAIAAWRAYRKKSASWTNIVPFLGRHLRDLVLFLWPANWFHRRYDVPFWVSKKKAAKLDTVANATRAQERDGDRVPIKFVGLFDTIEAYGVPLESLRSAIDKLIWPISFPIEEMSDKVLRVRHALSLDDERTTFHPIRIRRKYEISISEMLLATAPVRYLLAKIHGKGLAPHARTTELPQDPDRVREVWFVGVHSDIGGGYPDDQLAHIPLVWMLEEIREADQKVAEMTGRDSDEHKLGLRFRSGAEEDFRNASSPYGTLHDSRAGASVLYRYSPRRIATEGDGDDPIHDVVVHHTVIKRIRDGSDNYAPVNLPHDAKVLRADRETVPLQDYLEIRSASPRSSPGKVPPNYQEKQEHLLNLVLRRQVCYFLLLFALLLLVSIPVWEGRIGSLDPSSGGSPHSLAVDLGTAAIYFGGLVGALKYVTPSYLAPYLDSLHSHPFVVIPLIGFIFWFYARGNTLRDVVRDQARDIWKPSNGVRQRIDQETSSESRFRAVSIYRKRMDSLLHLYRKLMDWLQNHGFDPAKNFGVVAVIMGFLFVMFAGSVALSRIVFNLKLASGNVCMQTELEKKNLRWLGSDELLSAPDGSGSNAKTFTTSSPCWASGMAVEKGIAYRLRIDINLDDPWFDGAIMTDIGGFENDGFWLKVIKSPFLRWPSAGWFQPIARIDATGDVEWPLAANDGSGPIPADVEECKHMPKSYLDTPKFCEGHQKPFPCLEEREKTDAAMGTSLMGASLPLPKNELENAKKAWLETDGDWYPLSGGRYTCRSSYPRKTLVSDFVAQKTGQLFLFVNDAMPLFFLPNDTHYRNNSGSAKVTLMRAAIRTDAVSDKE